MSMFVITESMTQERNQPGSAAESRPAHSTTGASSYQTVKLALDLTLAFTLLVLTAPLILLAMILIKLTSRGPAIYSQTRLGHQSQPFTIYKLRTMSHNCESLTGALWSKPGDTRVTALGCWLRRTHIDELPQLWNVLRGDMSLIGPRPERPEFVPRLEQAIPHYRQRLSVRPGVTGMAQVQLPPDTDLESVRIKLAYDLFYVNHVNFFLDMRIYWATFFKMIGVPFPLIRKVYRFPARELVEGEYVALRPIVRPTASEAPRHDSSGTNAQARDKVAV